MTLPREQIQSDLLAILRGDPCLAAIVHATDADIASRTALRAIVADVDTLDEIRLVEEVTSEVIAFTGLFYFDNGAAPVDDNINVIYADNGYGYWLRYQTIEGNIEWGESSDNGGHVFQGIRPGMLRGARNRGRMPFIELEIGGGEFRDKSTSGGLTELTATMRCWYRDNRVGDYKDDLIKLMARVGRAIRNWTFNGDDGYNPGIETSYERRYRDATISYDDINEIPGALWGDVTAEVAVAYGESTLGGTT